MLSKIRNFLMMILEKHSLFELLRYNVKEIKIKKE